MTRLSGKDHLEGWQGGGEAGAALSVGTDGASWILGLIKTLSSSGPGPQIVLIASRGGAHMAANWLPGPAV